MSIYVTRVQTSNPFDITFVAHPLPIAGECASPEEAKQPIQGKLIMVPSYYVHTLEVAPACESPRTVVDALTTFAHGFTLRDRDHPIPGTFSPSGILFHVASTNDKMRRYVESKGATCEDGLLYRLSL